MSAVKVVGGLTAAAFLLVGGCTAVLGAGAAGLADQATGCAPAGPAIVQASATAGPAAPGVGAGSERTQTKIGVYKGAQLQNAGYVIKAGQSLGLDAWTITVGVMTTMGESGLRVLTYGDAAGPDSRGLWQQRANGQWGSLADRMDPTISSVNGFKAIIAVPGYRDLAPTVAAHRAQGNSDENYYAPFWTDAVKVVAALTKDPSLLASLPTTGGNVTAASGADCPVVDPASDSGGSTGGQAISGKWANPLKPAAYTLTSNFGEYRDYLKTAKLHKGQDLGAPGGTPIFAVCDGIVVQAGPVSGGGGNQTTIDCGGGITIKLMHQSVITTTTGTTLTAGEEIGKVGTTGNSTGNHLHEQVELNGVPVDPVPFMRLHGVPL